MEDKEAVSKTDSQRCPPQADITIMHLQVCKADREYTVVMNYVINYTCYGCDGSDKKTSYAVMGFNGSLIQLMCKEEREMQLEILQNVTIH